MGKVILKLEERAGAKLPDTDYEKLVTEYGQSLADKAKEWFESNKTADFAQTVKPFEFLVTNEYLWKSQGRAQSEVARSVQQAARKERVGNESQQIEKLKSACARAEEFIREYRQRVMTGKLTGDLLSDVYAIVQELVNAQRG